MRKAFLIYVLIAVIACDLSRGVLVHGGPARKPEAAAGPAATEYQKDALEQLDQVPRGSPVEDPREERSSEPVGKWRSNGEALEPKWRDGDSVPLLPFSHYRSYSKDDDDDDGDDDDAEQEEEEEEEQDVRGTTRRPFKYPSQSVNQNRPRGGSSKRLPSRDQYELTYRGRDLYDESEDDYPSSKRRRPLKSPRDSTLVYDETIESAASNDGKRQQQQQQQQGRNVVGESPSSSSSSSDDREAASARYREAFQARPNEYEHEFDDEEYLRPRPRKRRPPQNYEFALASEASSSGNVEESRGVITSRPTSQRQNGSQSTTTTTTTTTRSLQDARNQDRGRPENALELKSLLKMQQEEGSSLSEILQRRNLTLNDLLKGKADVINALKSRIADESDEYIEEMSRVMSDSLMKLAATVSPPWRSTQASKSTTTRPVVTSSTPNPVTFVPDKVSKSYNEISSSNDTSRIVKEESTEDTGRITQQQSSESTWLRATTIPSVSTVITTSTSPPAINSMEYFLNDDAINVGLTSDRGTRLESLDEDEIMEFSDFTDFKKAKIQPPAAPTWLDPSSGKIAPRPPSSPANRPAEDPRDIVGSTLSIEQILIPTERIVLAKDCASDRDDDTEGNEDRETGQSNARTDVLPSADDYGFIEAEYQNDAAIDLGVNDGARRNAARANPGANKGIADDKPETNRSPTDDRNGLRDKDQGEYHQANRSGGEKSYDRAPENHRGPNGARYEEVISEIEPEARAEIFELFASGSAGKRLERLLKSRNMSVEELIALRQRGSSKVHLTEVSRLKVRPKQKNLQSPDSVNSESISGNTRDEEISSSSSGSNKQRFGENAERKEAGTEHAAQSTNRVKENVMSNVDASFLDKNVENMSISRLLELIERDRNALRGSYLDYDAQYADSDLFDSLPFSKDIQRQLIVDNARNVPGTRPPVKSDNADIATINEEAEIVRSNNTSSEYHAGYVEEIVREEPNIVDIRTIYGSETSVSGNVVNGKGADEERKTLSKVKPSIIASGAILGVTIVVFLAIFVVCRIRQKQKYTYRNTFTRAVFQGPVLTARKLSNSSSMSTVMVDVVATSTTKRPERTEMQETADDFDGKSDMDNDSLDANDSWETIPDYAK